MADPNVTDAAVDRDRLDLIDTLAAGDGQEWPKFWENPQQQQTGETMYGPQADELLASTWLARREARAVLAALAALADEIEAGVEIDNEWQAADFVRSAAGRWQPDA